MTTLWNPSGPAIFAFQFTNQPISQFPKWLNGFTHVTDGHLEIPTHGGRSKVVIGEWVLLAPDGSFEVMTNAAFRASFTAAN